MPTNEAPIIHKKKFIKYFLKLIRTRLEKELPDSANEDDMTLKAWDVFYKGIGHLKKDEEMAYGDKSKL